MEYTKEQIVEITINNLAAINVPALLAEQIGIPVMKSIGNLKILQQMMKQEDEEDVQADAE